MLLADDDADVRDGIALLLRRDGYRVTTAASGTELVETLASWILRDGDGRGADAIVTDVRMPGFNGLNVVEALRAAGWSQPCIIISAYGDEAMRARARHLGAELLAKPFEPAALEAALALALHEW